MLTLTRQHLPISRKLLLEKEKRKREVVVAKFFTAGKAVYLERQLICDCADEFKAALVCEALNHTCAPLSRQHRAKTGA